MIQPVNPGDPISARHFNTVIGTVNQLTTTTGGAGLAVSNVGGSLNISPVTGPTRFVPAGTIVRAHNDGASEIAIYTPATVWGQVYTENDAVTGQATGRHGREPVLTIATPGAGGDPRKTVIALETIAVGAIGRVMLDGCCWAYVYATSTTSDCSAAVPVAGQTALALSPVGPVQVIHRDLPADETQPHLALVRFPHDTAGQVVYNQGATVGAGAALQIISMGDDGTPNVSVPTDDTVQPALVLFASEMGIVTGEFGYAVSAWDAPALAQGSGVTGTLLGTVAGSAALAAFEGDAGELTTAQGLFISHGIVEGGAFVRVRPFRGRHIGTGFSCLTHLLEMMNLHERKLGISPVSTWYDRSKLLINTDAGVVTISTQINRILAAYGFDPVPDTQDISDGTEPMTAEWAAILCPSLDLMADVETTTPTVGSWMCQSSIHVDDYGYKHWNTPVSPPPGAGYEETFTPIIPPVEVAPTFTTSLRWYDLPATAVARYVKTWSSEVTKLKITPVWSIVKNGEIVVPIDNLVISIGGRVATSGTPLEWDADQLRALTLEPGTNYADIMQIITYGHPQEFFNAALAEANTAVRADSYSYTQPVRLTTLPGHTYDIWFYYTVQQYQGDVVWNGDARMSLVTTVETTTTSYAAP